MLLAFLAGLASFLSPCVLPIVPLYLAYLTGTTLEELRLDPGRHRVLAHAWFFVLGFSLVFISLGASASVMGEALARYHDWIERLGGLVLIVLGLWMLGALKAEALYREARFHFAGKPAGYIGSIFVGGAFAAGWTPCVGPVLAGILLLASRSGSVAYGMLLLAVYSMGLAIPLLLCALAVERAMKVLNHVKRILPLMERATGACLSILGLVLAAGRYARVSTWLLSYFGGWARLFSRLGL